MSGTPNKRSHEESGGGQSSASRYSRDDSATYSNITPKLPTSASNDHHDMATDSPRLPKIPRSESRDVDQRHYSPHRVLQTILYDSQSDHPVPSEDRIEHKDAKNSNRDPKVDTKTGSRELYQSAKVGKDVRFSSRGEDGKETKSGWNTFPDYRSEMKQDKDGVYGTMNNRLNWKEATDHHRAKKYTEGSSGIAAPWQRSRTTIEGSAREEKDYTEGSKAIGENKVDMKGDDKLKDKDRKRKDGKPREWGESRNNLILGNSSNEFNESSKEEREAEKWEKERKDFSLDKGKVRDMEKDHGKRDARSEVEKEGLKTEKESIDVSVRAPDFDKEAKDKRKERNFDVEGERSENHPRSFDKELDLGGEDGEGEKDVLNYGIQQRKRMLRPRGSPQVGIREPMFRSQDQDNEGPKGKPDMSIVVYRIGECMQELIKLWKEYESSQHDKMSESSQNGPTLEIRIPAETVTATNRQVRGGQLWGTDIYTIDSDLVAVLMHTGYCRPTASPPSPVIQELRATIRVLPPQDCYISTLRNNVRSRAWGSAIGCSYRVERCCIVKKGGGMIDLEPCLTHTSTVVPTLAPVVVERTMTTRAAALNALRQQRFVQEVTIQYNLSNEPWIKYSISAVADKGLKKPLFTSARLKKDEVLYMESHSCRYELCFNGEKMVKAIPSSHENGTESDKHQAQGVHLTNGERSTTDCDTVVMDVFRWSRCKTPLPLNVMRTNGIPLPLEYLQEIASNVHAPVVILPAHSRKTSSVLGENALPYHPIPYLATPCLQTSSVLPGHSYVLEVIEENLDWEEIQWSQTGVWIRGKEYPLARVHFMSPK